jgi:hypothetical protein
MKITINGKEITDGDGQPLDGKTRLKWSEIGRLAGIPRVTNAMDVTVQLPDEKAPKQHLHGFSLVLVDGMAITARP